MDRSRWVQGTEIGECVGQTSSVRLGWQAAPSPCAATCLLEVAAVAWRPAWVGKVQLAPLTLSFCLRAGDQVGVVWSDSFQNRVPLGSCVMYPP